MVGCDDTTDEAWGLVRVFGDVGGSEGCLIGWTRMCQNVMMFALRQNSKAFSDNPFQTKEYIQ